METALQCVEETKNIFLDGYYGEVKVKYKGKIDPVTQVDTDVEAKVISIIQKNHPDHSILAEESHEKHINDKPFRWIVDPLDGTVNFAHKVPHFALSIGLEKEGELILALVYNPIVNEIYMAEKGKGAFFNNKPIQVSKRTDISKCLLGTGFPYDCHQKADLYTSELKLFMEKAEGIRRPGVASLDLCYVACGRFDGFWERELKPWDVAGGILLVEEAGGKISNFKGNSYQFGMKTIIVSNGNIHEEMLQTLSLGNQ